jgi:SpoVK/Ycf46/Vps4 family AAA+-type ATPase
MKVKVFKVQNNILNDINIPHLHIKTDEFPEGIYPLRLTYEQNSHVITCNVIKSKNIKENSIYLSNINRTLIYIELGTLMDVEEPGVKIFKLNNRKLPKFIIKVDRVEGSSMGKITLSTSKIVEIIEGQLSNICINNGTICLIHDIETQRYIRVIINIDNDTHNICIYNGEKINEVKVELGELAKKKCILLDTNVGQSMEMLKTLDLSSLGIGGLKGQIVELLRRVFASRACHPQMIQSLEISHVKGVLLYGPPGTGKTLIARQLGKMLNSVAPIIVNGPEIMSKYVGESAENIRRLFSAAETDYAENGEYSRLHVIIFDEFDAIAGKRTSGDSAGSQVGNQIVNQLLSKMDGIDSLNNILIFGLTNRKELIDSALLRPGRFEVQLEIGIPNQHSRKEIFDIHLEKAKTKGALSSDVDTTKLSQITDNFTGAEIAGVIRNATTFAICRQINESDSKNFKLEKSSSICIRSDDLFQAIEDSDPLFGKDIKVLNTLIPDDVVLNQKQQLIFDTCFQTINKYLSNDINFQGQSLKILLTGKNRCGKSTLAAYISKSCNINNVIYLSNFELIGENDYSKNSKLKETFLDATNTDTSVIILDDIDNIMELSDTKRGFIFNNSMLQTLKTLCTKAITNKIVLICTSGSEPLVHDIGLFKSFHLSQIIED